jgi:Calx-beta domain-containing protein
MKTVRVPFCLHLLCLIVIARPAGAQESTIIERGAHHDVIQTILPDGSTNSFNHLQTGLNRWSEADNQYVPASAEVEVVNGLPLARKTQYQVIFGTTSAAPEGAVDVLMLDGRRLRVRPIGLAYTEYSAGQPGRSAFVGETNVSAAEVTGPSEVTYANALSGVSASVRYRVSVAGLEQDIVLTSALPLPGEFQMNEALVRVEVWNEILESPAPEKHIGSITRADGSVDRDDQLSFDVMLFGAGSAFDGAGKSIRVARQWQEIEGKVFLVESVPYSELKPLLASLPTDSQGRSIDAEKLRDLWAKQSNRGRSLPVSGIVRSERRVARAGVSSSRGTGVVLDWTLLAAATNFTFKGDTTYYLNGAVTLSATTNGATAIEGGTVVKFTNSTAAQITISGAVSCQTSPYRPAVFTSKDDDSIGEKVTGSSSSPSGYYGAGLRLDAASLNDLRFAFANTALSVNGNQNLTLADVQFVKCKIVIHAYGTNNLYLENALFSSVESVAETGPLTLRGAHWTMSQCGSVGSGLASSGTTSFLYLTNSILFAVTNWGFVDTNRFLDAFNVETPNSFGSSGAPNPFQTAGAGAHYLALDTAFRDSGTTSLNASLLARLTRKTTYPPAMLVSHFTGNTTLTVRDIRDVDVPDLGWHYDNLDYLWTSLDVTNNSTLTLTNGVTVGSYGPRLIWLRGTSKLVSEGTPINLNRLVTFHTVQEQPLVLITNTALMTLINGADVTLRFTDVSVMAASTGGRRLIPEGPFNSTVTIRDSQLRGVYWSFYNYDGSGATTPTIHLTNSFLERCTIDWTQGYNIVPFDGDYLYLTFQNNLFTRSSVTLRHFGSYYGSWDIYDNLFDNCSVNKSEHGSAPYGSSLTTVGYNGFINTSNPFGGSGNKTGLLRDFEKGLLGDYYYPASGATNSLAALINAGSKTNAALVGLDKYTTTTNQVTEGTNTLDIGYHFFGVNTSTTVTISATDTNAVENGDPGEFTVTRTGSTAAALTVFYSVSGSAINGVDYTSLSGSVVIQSSAPSATITVNPIDDSLLEVPESVTMTLILTNTYLVGTPDHASLTIKDDVDDDLSDPESVATLNGPTGIDYHPATNALIVAFNQPTGNPHSFLRIASNGASTNWTTLSGMGFTDGEIKLAVVPTTANGWTAGDMYFGTAQTGKIGRISANGSTVNTNWATLTNASQGVGETSILLAGMHVDRTGVFNGDLIVASGSGGVWRVTSSTNATKLAQVDDEFGDPVHLEGTLTLPNDPSKYGPWAGKILTCGEQTHLLYTVDTNGAVASLNFGIDRPDDADLVVTNQNLFIVSRNFGDPPNSSVLKFPKTAFDGFVDDVVIPEEISNGVVVLHWDGVKFVMRRLTVQPSAVLEQAAFAPIEAEP